MQPHHPDASPRPSWNQRPKPIGQALTYRIDGDVLEIDTVRKVDRISLSSIEQVRFVFAPSNVTSKAFKTKLSLKGGRSVTFGNLSWRSLTDIDRDDAGYHAFVTALSVAVAKTNPQARFVAGRPFGLWLALTLVGGSAIAMLGAFSARAFAQGSHQAGWLGLLLVAASIWQVWPMVRLNRPRRLATGEVPDELVPGGPGEA